MKNILVVGLGAVGTVFATFLKESKHNVYGLVKDHHLEFVTDNTLHVEGIWGNHKAKLDLITSNIEDLERYRF
jgi:Ketopantoate reductase